MNSEQKTNTAENGGSALNDGLGENSNTDVAPLAMANNIVIRKWHEGNNKYEECSLRELWENGFANGQSFQGYNKHLQSKKYMNANCFHVETEFFDEVWKAFWSDLTEAEVILIAPNAVLSGKPHT